MSPTFISEVAATCECSVSVGASIHFEVSALPSTFVLSGSRQLAFIYGALLEVMLNIYLLVF